MKNERRPGRLYLKKAEMTHANLYGGSSVMC